MLKKLSGFLIPALFILQCVVPCFAVEGGTAASISVVSTCCVNSHVYCYVQSSDPDVDFSSISMGVASDDFSSSEMRSPQVVGGSSCAVSYLFLIDLSTSMVGMRAQLSAFADALLQAEQQAAQVTIAGFGEAFTVLEEDLSDPDQVLQALDRLSYTQQASDISGGVADAAAYLLDHSRLGGTLTNLVVLTDGEAYLPGSGTRRSALKKAADAAQQIIENTPEIVVHTVGFGEWESSTFKAVSSGGGIDLSVRNLTAAAKAGDSLAQFVDGLYYMDFPFTVKQNSEFIEAQLMLSSASGDLEFIPLKTFRNLDYTGFSPSGEPPENEPEDTESEDGEETGGSISDGEDRGTGEPDEEASGMDMDNDAMMDGSLDDGEAPEASGAPWALMAAGAAAVLLVAVLAGVLLGRNRKQGQGAPAAGGSIWIRLEALSENAVTPQTDYLLRDELFIGSDRSCHIVFGDESVSARNSRIYLQDEVVYMEDLASNSGTMIGGMKIFGPNRLRNGDEVIIGRVRFRVELLKSHG